MTSLYSISLLYNFSNISNLSNCSKFTWALLCFEVFYSILPKTILSFLVLFVPATNTISWSPVLLLLTAET